MFWVLEHSIVASFMQNIYVGTRFMIQICTKNVVTTWLQLILDIINIKFDDHGGKCVKLLECYI